MTLLAGYRNGFSELSDTTMQRALHALLNYTSSQLARPPSCKQPPLALTPYRCHAPQKTQSTAPHCMWPRVP